jgi:serine/threonine protein kinase
VSDRYKIRAKIGEGGAGAVWVAFDSELNRDVALKRLKKRDAVDADGKHSTAAADGLIREAQALASLQHPNIVTFYDAGRDDEGVFLAMELLRGKTLDAVIEMDGPLAIEDFQALAEQTLAGVVAAQERNLVHRDLKPGNIMVHRQPTGELLCKVLDFGLAKFSHGASLQTEDQESGIYGSVHFMAPEQFERKPLDGRTDLYALGCIFYYALAGRYPFAGDTNAEVMASHLQHSVPLLKDMRPELPEWIGDWVMWFLNRNAEHRPATAAAGLEHFLQCVADDAEPVPTPQPPPVEVDPEPPGVTQVRPGRRKSPMGLLAVLMLTATVVGLSIWGYGIYSQRSAEKREIELFNRLTLPGNDEPVGNADAVNMITRMMQDNGGNIAAQGALCLEKLTGPGVETAIVAQIGKAVADTRVKIMRIATQRKLEGTSTQLIAAAESRVQKVSEAALSNLVEIAQPYDLDALIGMLQEHADVQRNRQLITEAIYVAASRADGSQGSVRLIAALAELEGGRERGSLLRVLGRLGGDEALSTLERELRSDDMEAQRSAVSGLTAWPNGKAAAPLSSYAVRTEDENLQGLAMLGLMKIIGRSGDLPGEEKIAKLKKAAKMVKGSQVRKALFQQLSKIPDEAALMFLEELSADGGTEATENARYAEQAKRQITEMLTRVVDVAGEEEVMLNAEKSFIAGHGPFFNRIDNTVQSWGNPAAWVLWHVRIAEPGVYQLKVVQAQSLDVSNTFDVTFAGSVLPCEVKQTRSEKEFERIDAGNVELTEPGLYEIIIKPKKIEGESLMVLRGISLRRNL